MPTLTIARVRTDDDRKRSLADMDEYAINHPGQTIFSIEELAAMHTHNTEYEILFNHRTDTEYAQGLRIREANNGIHFLRMADSQCQQVVKFKIEGEKPGWDVNIYTLYGMATSNPLVSRTTSLAKVRTVSEKIISGEHTRVVTLGGVALDWAVDVATQYAALIAPGGKLVLRSNSIIANNASIDALGVKNNIVDPFITMCQDKIEASGGGLTKAQVRAIGTLWGLKYISIGDMSTITLLVKERISLGVVEGGVCHAEKYDPLVPPSNNPATGAAGLTNVFGIAVIKTLRVGGIDIIVDIPGYIRSVTHETILEGSTNTYTILVDLTPPVVLV